MGACLTSLASEVLLRENEHLRAQIEELQRGSKKLQSRDLDKRSDPTALCDAAAAGDLAWLRLVSEAGANLSVGDYDKRTAMHLAASEGHVDVIAFLIDVAKVDPSPHDRWGGTPLDDAIRSKKVAAVELLLSRRARKGLTAMDHAETDMCDAASKGDVGRLREMIGSGYIAGVGDYDKRTPLHLAASENRIAALKFLVEEAHVEVNPVDRWNNSPLDDALRSRHSEAAEYLRAHGGASAKAPTIGFRAPSKIAAHMSPNFSRRSSRDKGTALSMAPGAADMDRLSKRLDDKDPAGAPPAATPERSRRVSRQNSIPFFSSLPVSLTLAPAATAIDEALPDEDTALHRLGHLTKLSKGGFTANWNRRIFALLGSSLYYADSMKVLKKAGHAKLFANLAGCSIRSLPDTAALPAGNGLSQKVPVRNVFILSWPRRNGDDSGGSSKEGSRHNGSTHGGSGEFEEVLLLSADTSAEKELWINALVRSRQLPPCPLEHVPALVLAGEIALPSDSDGEEEMQQRRPSASEGAASDSSRQATKKMSPLEALANPEAWMMGNL